MTAVGRPVVHRGPAAALTVALQVLTGLGAHLAVHGCLPGTGAPLLVSAVVTACVIAANRLQRGSSRRLRLAGGQLAVHLSLSAFAACPAPVGHPSAATGHVHAGGVSIAVPLLMLAAHLAAVALCLTVLDRAQGIAHLAVERAQRLADRLLTPLTAPTTAPLSRRPLPATAASWVPRTAPQDAHRTRGPPARTG